jgi:cytochrome c oxidase assembly protein subunit 11
MRVARVRCYSFTKQSLRLANTLVLQAIPSVSPGLAARHFQKVECFCFSKQTLRPGEGRDMPVTFRLDPGVPLDIATITLSYTFFRLEDQGSEI